MNYEKQKCPKTLSCSGFADYLKVKTTPGERIPTDRSSVSENLYNKLTKDTATPRRPLQLVLYPRLSNGSLG